MPRSARPLIISAAQPARAGLANELIPVAKAYLAARALGVPMVPPAWGRNRRPYWRHFSHSRLDVVSHALAVAGRRRLTFTEEAYWATGVIEYGDAVRVAMLESPS